MSNETRAAARPYSDDATHPRTFEPAMLVVLVVVSILGSIIGIQILTSLGVTPNTAIIGVLVAIAISRIPLEVFRRFRSIHRQNLVQSNISAATFVAANSLLLPIAVPYVMKRPDLVWPMLIGAGAAAVIDFLMLYWMFDSRVFPGKEAWPPGIAAAEAIKAGDEGGKRAGLLGIGTLVGLLGSYIGIPMSAFGVAFIGNIVALTMFGVGLLIRGYGQGLSKAIGWGGPKGIDINALYIPHGVMIGAGLIALAQAVSVVVGRRRAKASVSPHEQAPVPVAAGPLSEASVGDDELTRDPSFVQKALVRGGVLYVLVGIALALASGIYSQMSVPRLILWVVWAAFSCIAAEFIVGLSAMHSGWFPAFATALIFLTLGMFMGFPPIALALLVGFIAAGGPAFADAGYDFKAGWLLRRGRSREMELDGRREQLFAALVGMVVAFAVVALAYPMFFTNNQFPPVAKVFATTISAGANPAILGNLALWAVPGAVIQLLGGAKRQMGILLATGLLIFNPLAGWAVLAGIVIRVLYRHFAKDKERADTDMTVMAAGFIAGDALWSFGSSMYKIAVK
ncbi:MAG TPA: OPT/YSL family transporter [Propionibacteriaceae bacterium]|nr:OPT/YSL family transporter [Propionibacteriaceae bacterium]